MNDNTSKFCTACGSALHGQEAYCSQCGAPIAQPATGQGELVWDANISAGDLLRGAAKVLALAFGFVFIMLEIITCWSGESFVKSIAVSTARGDSSVYYAGGFIGFWLLVSALAVWAIYRKGYEATFGVGPDGVFMRTRPGTAKTNRVINGALFWLSLFSGKPGGMGTAILADASQSGFFEWEDIQRIIPEPERRVITLKGSWRTLVKLYCTAENYHAVLQLLEQYSKLHEPARLAKAASAPGAGSYVKHALTVAGAVGAVALIGGSPLLPKLAGVYLLGLLVLASFVTGGPVRRKVAYLIAAVWVGLALAMAINAYEPLGDYLVRYHRYDRLTRMPYLAEFAASLAGMAAVAVLTWHRCRKLE